MEIYSTGEKIKRARIYKGITLKELCGEKISISKMSCIENGKVKADEEILRYVADILQLDYEYIAKDVYEQIIDNIKLLENEDISEKDREDYILLNLEYATHYEYYKLAFKLIHKLFNYYLNENRFDEILDIVPKYYDLYRRNNSNKATIIYFKDMANYFYINKEYSEARSYYNRVLEILIKDDDLDKELYSYILYREGMCLLKCGEYCEAEKCLKAAKEAAENLDSREIKGKIYYASSIIGILNKDIEEENLIKSYEFLDDNIRVIESKIDFAGAYFIIGEEEKALKEINEAMEMLPNDNTYKVGRLYVKGATLLKRNNKIDLSEKFADKALNISIETNNIELIEKAYYLKGKLLQNQDRYREAELYMNLSLDSLVKFGTKKDLYNRYIDMANMYHKTKEINDSIKYFTLAMKMQKKI
ncbi:helix-turn-helix domain-containing protein [Eubacterium multiforme]|uniref:Tetratricopeptide (TPR) repeat protein n=1 Tax=Eubacterium multiforme TaxID=83339 RepID=A0ABT9UPL4_9FIRM|nr:helix-turn-helix transcriptional regulator [Eubacterium multiforme]MDQ0148587.1 tetratricopeptide (TPR) repeat protein [Eubacterium multiforme]